MPESIPMPQQLNNDKPVIVESTPPRSINPVDELLRIVEENKKLLFLKGRLDELRVRLLEVEHILKGVITDFDPRIDISLQSQKRQRKSAAVTEEIREAAFAWMEMGNEIDVPWIVDRFPNLSYPNATFIMKGIAQSPHVERRRNGLRYKYFLKKSA